MSKPWKDRTILHIPTIAMKRLKKGKRAQMLCKGTWYELVPSIKVTLRIGGKAVKLSKSESKIMEKLVAMKRR